MPTDLATGQQPFDASGYPFQGVVAVGQHRTQSGVILLPQVVSDPFLDLLGKKIREGVVIDKPDVVAAAQAGDGLDVLGNGLLLEEEGASELGDVGAFPKGHQGPRNDGRVKHGEENGQRGQDNACHFKSRHGGAVRRRMRPSQPSQCMMADGASRLVDPPGR